MVDETQWRFQSSGSKMADGVSALVLRRGEILRGRRGSRADSQGCVPGELVDVVTCAVCEASLTQGLGMIVMAESQSLRSPFSYSSPQGSWISATSLFLAMIVTFFSVAGPDFDPEVEQKLKIAETAEPAVEAQLESRRRPKPEVKINLGSR